MESSTFQTILATIGDFISWFLGQMTAILTNITTNPYFLFAIIVLFATAVIALVLRFFKSFGLKKGSRRRR